MRQRWLQRNDMAEDKLSCSRFASQKNIYFTDSCPKIPGRHFFSDMYIYIVKASTHIMFSEK